MPYACSVRHPSAEIASSAFVPDDVQVWHGVQIRERVIVGFGTILGKNVYVDFGVVIGNNCKIQNNVSIYHGVVLGNGVFVGPHVTFTNDPYPRAVNPDGSLRGAEDWTVIPTAVNEGASIGAGAVILPGIVIGEWAMVGAGAVVTENVPAYGLVVGNPAHVIGWVDRRGQRITGPPP